MTLNLLPIAMAATAILGCNKQFTYIEYSETETIINDIGVEVPAVKLEASYTGSVQAVSNKMYEQLGLNLSENYKVIYCPELLQSMAEKPTTGRILYDGKTWDIIENQNWYETNGFTKVIICENKSLRGINDSSNNQPENKKSDI